jgi:hypothetical protein
MFYKIVTFVFLIVVAILILYNQQRGKQGYTPYIRKLAPLEALEEAVGRAAEMNQPVHGAAGVYPINSQWGGLTLVGMSILNHVARLSARYNATAFFTNMESINHPALLDAVRSGYVAEGRPELFRDDTVRFVIQDKVDAMAYGAAIGTIFDEEKPAVNIMVGGWEYETLMVIQSAHRVGAVTIGGAIGVWRLPDFVAGADYVLLGEELMVAGAYLEKDPISLGSILSQDWIKYLVLGLSIIGFLLSLAGNTWLYDFLQM